MHKVKMLKTCLGCSDGINVKPFFEGEVYELSDGLLADFVSLGAVELVLEEAKKDSKKSNSKEESKEAK